LAAIALEEAKVAVSKQDPKLVPVVTLGLKCTDCRKFNGEVSPTIIPNESGDRVIVHYICPSCGTDMLNPRHYKLCPA